MAGRIDAPLVPQEGRDLPPRVAVVKSLLNGWANQIAARFSAPVWLVGSTLEKERPRDTDIVVVLPDEQFFRRYGITGLQTQTLGDLSNRGDEEADLIRAYWEDMAKLGAWANAHHGGGSFQVDFKVQDESLVAARRHDVTRRVRIDSLDLSQVAPPAAPPAARPEEEFQTCPKCGVVSPCFVHERRSPDGEGPSAHQSLGLGEVPRGRNTEQGALAPSVQAPKDAAGSEPADAHSPAPREPVVVPLDDASVPVSLVPIPGLAALFRPHPDLDKAIADDCKAEDAPKESDHEQTPTIQSEAQAPDGVPAAFAGSRGVTATESGLPRADDLSAGTGVALGIRPRLPLDPRTRAREALTVLIHEGGTGTIHLSGLTAADIHVDLEQRVADAIADAEEAVAKPLRDALRDAQQQRTELEDKLAGMQTDFVKAVNDGRIAVYVEAPKALAEARAEVARLTEARDTLQKRFEKIGVERFVRVNEQFMLLKAKPGQLFAERAAELLAAEADLDRAGQALRELRPYLKHALTCGVFDLSVRWDGVVEHQAICSCGLAALLPPDPEGTAPARRALPRYLRYFIDKHQDAPELMHAVRAEFMAEADHSTAVIVDLHTGKSYCGGEWTDIYEWPR